MRRALYRPAWLLLCFAGCIPDVDRFHVGARLDDAGVDASAPHSDLGLRDGASADGSVAGTDGGVAGACVPGALTLPTCGALPHFLLATSSAAGITVVRQSPGGSTCPDTLLPVAGPALAVAERSNGDVAVIAGSSVAIASGGMLFCAARAGSVPIDLFTHDDQFAIAWAPSTTGPISVVQQWQGTDVDVSAYGFQRLGQSAFEAYDLIGSTAQKGAGAARTVDADEPTTAEPAYDTVVGVGLGAVTGDGATRMAFVGVGDEDATVFILTSRTQASPVDWICPSPLARAIPTYGNANTYRLLDQTGALWTLDTQAETCTADGVPGVDAIGLSVPE